MGDIFNLLLGLLGGFFEFLSSFEVINGVSLLRLIIVVILFYLSIYFLINKKE